jgi:very-short-patch-repair endonuclease
MHNNPTTVRARELRNTPNAAQQHLWNALKSRKLAGYRFTRQFPVGPYFADFACRRELLLIELDGSQHVGSSYDAERDAFLARSGYSVLRLSSGDVLRDCSSACDGILAALEGRMDSIDDSLGLRFQKSAAPPIKFRRHRPWLKEG